MPPPTALAFLLLLALSSSAPSEAGKGRGGGVERNWRFRSGYFTSLPLESSNFYDSSSRGGGKNSGIYGSKLSESSSNDGGGNSGSYGTELSESSFFESSSRGGGENPIIDGSIPVLPSRRVILEKTSNSTGKNHQNHRNKAKKIVFMILGLLAGAVAGLVSGLAMSVFFRLMIDCVNGRFRTPKDPTVFSSVIKKEDLAFLLKDDGLEGMEVIGRGGCGEVYRAILPGNPEKVIAIKKIKRFHVSNGSTEPSQEESKLLERGMRQLQSEIRTVGKIRHRNLIPLLGHVAQRDCHFLIYEFMKKGSLQDALRKSSEGTEDLPWPTRLKIAQGIAAGLEYLHTQHIHRIIHRDLKPANILLDDDLEARITDFGLAKAMPDANTHMTTSHVAGTVGYIAPEYHQVLKFTEKCDIYSFGVILAVLVTGKMPSNEYFLSTEEMSMVKWLRNIMKDNEEGEFLSEVFDVTLKGQGFEEEMILVLKIACFCTSDEPKERPNSKDVRCMLNQVSNGNYGRQ